MGAFVMLSSQDFLTLYLGMELMSIPVYFLIASSFVYRRASVEGALKYFIAGSLASLFYLLSLGIIYYFIGAISFKEVFIKLAQGLYKKEMILALLLILSAFSVKLSLVPFHMWALMPMKPLPFLLLPSWQVLLSLLLWQLL